MTSSVAYFDAVLYVNGVSTVFFVIRFQIHRYTPKDLELFENTHNPIDETSGKDSNLMMNQLKQICNKN